jgi:hypothetical protein
MHTGVLWKLHKNKDHYKEPRPVLRLESNIKMDLRGRGWRGMDWIHLAEDSDL